MCLNKLLYVAGPYAGDIEKNIKNAEKISIKLIKNGFHVLTPHKNLSGYEKYEDNNLTVQTWLKMDIDLLSRCDAIYVLKNYELSLGTLGEIEYAKKHNMLIIYEYDYPNLTLNEYSQMM